MVIKCTWSEPEEHNDEADAVGCVTYPATLTNEHSASSYRIPVVVIDGEARGVVDVPPGELIVPPAYLDDARAAGYPAQPLQAPRSYWRRGRRLRHHWHADARLVQY